MCPEIFTLLITGDFPGRENLCHCFVQRSAEHFCVSSVLFTDEARFGTDGVISIHNQHHWTEENPHGVIHSRHQQHFSINMWAGIVGDCLVGVHVLSHRLTDNHYRDFLLRDLQKLLEDVPLAVRTRMLYMHDGAPAPSSRAERNVLNTMTDG
jgi:hypothetical protein